MDSSLKALLWAFVGACGVAAVCTVLFSGTPFLALLFVVLAVVSMPLDAIRSLWGIVLGIKDVPREPQKPVKPITVEEEHKWWEIWKKHPESRAEHDYKLAMEDYEKQVAARKKVINENNSKRVLSVLLVALAFIGVSIGAAVVPSNETIYENYFADISENNVVNVSEDVTSATLSGTTTVTTTEAPTTTTVTTTKAPTTTTKARISIPVVEKFDIKKISKFTEFAHVDVNNCLPYFTDADYTTTSFAEYSPLDSLGRCGVAFACIGSDIMPTEKRGEIGMIKPTGWHTVKYDCIADKYLYNRCHLIAFELAGENANERNLITGTRFMNVTGMLPYENAVADYVRATDNHVLYRVTPVFEGNNLVATGVLMEAWSVEDNGRGISFNVFCYNGQPHIQINYADGSSKQISGFVTTVKTTKKTTKKTSATTRKPAVVAEEVTYVINVRSGKFHKPGCSSVTDMALYNRKDVTWTRDEVIAAGYEPCQRCHP